MRSDKQRLSDILERIDRILAHAPAVGVHGDPDEWAIDALTRNLEVIGEAARELSATLRRSHPEVDWREMIAFRVFATHVYWRLDSGALSRIVDELPELRKKIVRIRVD